MLVFIRFFVVKKLTSSKVNFQHKQEKETLGFQLILMQVDVS